MSLISLHLFGENLDIHIDDNVCCNCFQGRDIILAVLVSHCFLLVVNVYLNIYSMPFRHMVTFNESFLSILGLSPIPFRGMVTFIVPLLSILGLSPMPFPGMVTFIVLPLSILGLRPMPFRGMMTFIVRYPS